MLLSIIVPLHNSAAYLPRCLESLLHQDISLEEYEIIMVNDGSPDNSLVIANEYALKYPNIRVFSQENKGTSGARNTGLLEARGKYVYFVDPDDYVLENSLRVILNRMEEASLDVLRFGYIEVDEQGAPTKSCKHPEKPDYSSKILDGFSFMFERLGTACFVWTFLFRTALLKENNLYFDVHAYIDDTPWLPKVLAVAERVDSIDFKRHFYTIREGSLVRAGCKNADRIIAAQKWLIDELIYQLKQTDNEKGERWYRNMIAHTVLSLLSTIGLNRINQSAVTSAWLKERSILPLKSYRKDARTEIKLFVTNISPAFFCQLIHLHQFAKRVNNQ